MRYIGPVKILAAKGNANTLAIPSAMRLHLKFYVGSLERYYSVLLLTDQVDQRLEHSVVLDVSSSADLADAT